MKILHLCDGIPPFTLGGAGGMMHALACEQARRGHQVHVLAATPKGALPPPSPDWTAHALPMRGKRFAHWRSVFSRTLAKEVADAVRSFAPEAVHVHAAAFHLGYRWIPLVRRSGIPVVVTFHDVMYVRYGKVVGNERYPAWKEFWDYRWSYNPFRHAMIKHFLRSTDALVSVSDALRTYLERYALGRIRTVHNGIDLAFWSPRSSRANARARLGLPARDPLFLIAGRLGAKKGFDTAIAALPSGASLIAAGSASGLRSDHVRVFPGQTADGMRDLYEACNAVLAPSDYLDPFPTVCLEAMAMGRAVLATTMGGAPEAVVDGETGWTIDPTDVAAWSERMRWCAEHPDETDAKGKAGRHRAEHLFSIERMADDMDRVYAEAMVRSGTPAA